jgi:5-formyltetrahydrofolate cyclo-ligase
MAGEDDNAGEYASPACFMHEVDPTYFGLSPGRELLQQNDVMRWRKLERTRLINECLEMSVAMRRYDSDRIAEQLDATIGDVSGRIVSAYWPLRGEPDLREWLERVASRGGRYALPVVVKKQAPLVFRTWRRGEKLERGVWNIPVPAAGEEVCPDIVIAPVVGYDRNAYRLGYGGGYFDRTLAAIPRRPMIIGVGYSQAAIPTIYPQLHDIPMDKIVTERDILSPEVKISAANAGVAT